MSRRILVCETVSTDDDITCKQKHKRNVVNEDMNDCLTIDANEDCAWVRFGDNSEYWAKESTYDSIDLVLALASSCWLFT